MYDTREEEECALTQIFFSAHLGCWTCRFRKKKCDEVKPVCNQCATLRIQCDVACEKQPLYMRDDRAAQQKKADIKAQMGKRRRRRRKKNEERRAVAAGGSSSSAAAAAAAAAVPSRGEGQGLLPPNRSPSQSFDTSQDTDDWEREDSLEFDEEVSRFGPVDESLNSGPGTARQSYIMNRGRPLSVNSSTALNWGAPQTAEYGAETSSTPPLSAVPYTSVSRYHQMPFRELDAYLTFHIPFETAVEVNLLKHYIYDVCTYTYRGISENSLTGLINTVLVPRLQINKSFLYSCISGGLGHLRNIAVARYDSGEAERLEMTITQYKVRIYQTLQQQVAADAPKDELLATILGLLNHEVRRPPDPFFHGCSTNDNNRSIPLS
jgi:hypothetical protein